MGVDALLVSGVQAGVSADVNDLRAAKQAAEDTPVLANTGVTHGNVTQILQVADGIIVGTSLKVGGSTWNPVDRDRAVEMVRLAKTSRAKAA